MWGEAVQLAEACRTNPCSVRNSEPGSADPVKLCATWLAAEAVPFHGALETGGWQERPPLVTAAIHVKNIGPNSDNPGCWCHLEWDPIEPPVIPAKAGIQSDDSTFPKACGVDSRFRGNDCLGLANDTTTQPRDRWNLTRNKIMLAASLCRSAQGLKGGRSDD